MDEREEMSKLIFKPETHEYFVDGIRYPSVTQVLNEWILTYSGYVNTITDVVIGKEVFEAAQDFGSAIHLAIKYLLTTGLNWDGLDPSLIPPLKQFEQWRKDIDLEVLNCEEPMFSQRYGYAGTPDIIAGSKNGLVLVDIKTGDYGRIEAQVAAYEQLYREHVGVRRSIEKRVLYLPKDGGDYKFEQVNDKDSWSYFLSKLNIWKYQHK
jgi:hypothetical protein